MMLVLLLLAQAQVERTVPLPADAPAQEIATVVRSITGVAQLSLNAEATALTLRGSAADLALGEWLVSQLRPDPSPAAEFRVAPRDVVRVVRLQHALLPRQRHQIATHLRTIGELRQLFACSAPASIVVRGTPEEIAFTDWLVRQLDRPSAPAAATFTLGNDTIRLFPLQHASAEEIATVVRTLGNLPRLLAYSDLRVLTLRGSKDDLALAAWLLGQLDRPLPPTQDPGAFPLPGGEALRLYSLEYAGTPQSLQEAATLVRSLTGSAALMAYPPLRALAIRGRAAQLALATFLIGELKQPSSATFDVEGERVQVVRVNEPQRVLEAAVKARPFTRSVYAAVSRQAIALRGTRDQVAQAERAIRDADRP